MPGEGAGCAGAETAPEPEPLLLPPLGPILEPPLGTEPEPALGESRVMLGGNMRRGSGTRSRPEEGEGVGGEVTPELLPPLLDTPPP